MKHLKLAALCGLIGIVSHATAQEAAKPAADPDEKNPAAALETPTVEVIANTPLPGIGIAVNEVPANVQAATGEAIRQQQATDLTEFLERNLGSVNVGSGQANSFQPDLNFRGFQGSSLLGVPQGLSAFVDGVRINESFGDTINWDLIPTPAISSIQLVPGSNPVFGLNTLGGALSINTKSGRTHPGIGLTLQGGSWERKQATVEAGSKAGNWDFYVMGNYLDEKGWRVSSSNRIQQLFGKVGYETGDFDADLSYSFADNELNGTQTSPLSLLNFDPRLAYTYPDTTKNRMNFVNLRLSKVLNPENILSGNVYYRGMKSSNVGSNVNDTYDGTGNPNCDGTNPDNPCPGSNDKSLIDTSSFGGTLQYTRLGRLLSKENRLTVGLSYDQGNTNFTQAMQLAVFTADRNTIPDPANPNFAPETDVDTVTRYYGVFLTDTYSFNDITHLTLSGRWNRARVNITDRSGVDPGLNGDHTFTRFNPAVGLNYNPSTALNTYVSYNEGMRAPTAIELTCADPAAPCKLPNAFLSDPALNPVVSKTYEIGTRGLLSPSTQYSVAIFRTDLRDDIQFIASSGTGTAGYFANVGKTRRQGLELGLQQRFGSLSLRGAYSYIDATFQSTFNIASPNNSSADPAGQITVQPGDRIPAIPRHNFKLRADYAFTPMVQAGLNVVYASDQFARGDENNQDVNGKVPSYTLVNLDGSWRITNQLQIFGKLTNLFDTTFQTFGILGENFFRGPGFTHDATLAGPEQFRTPGLPRAFFAGVRYDFLPNKTASSDNDIR